MRRIQWKRRRQIGEIALRVERRRQSQVVERIRILVREQVPPDFQLEQANSLGLRLVRMFARQLRAEVIFQSEPGRTLFDIQFVEAAVKPL